MDGNVLARYQGLVQAHRGERFGLLQVWLARYRQRRQLARLDTHLLKDIGLSRTDALREVHKPFWRA